MFITSDSCIRNRVKWINDKIQITYSFIWKLTTCSQEENPIRMMEVNDFCSFLWYFCWQLMRNYNPFHVELWNFDHQFLRSQFFVDTVNSGATPLCEISDTILRAEMSDHLKILFSKWKYYRIEQSVGEWPQIWYFRVFAINADRSGWINYL